MVGAAPAGRVTRPGNPTWAVPLALVVLLATVTACTPGAPAAAGDGTTTTRVAAPATTTRVAAPATTTRVAAPATSTRVAAPTTPTSTSTTSTTDPGSLPQTTGEPSLGAGLRAQLGTLWNAIVTGSTAEARTVFFPRTAYLRMKAGVLPDPAADYADRLLAFLDLDVATYHQALGSGVSGATLLGVSAAPADAAWIPAGACENTIGYWHLPGVRLVYRDAGEVRSFAVASLISWRSTWYVVHLGPNPRPSNVGTVDAPAAGPGTPGPAGGC